MPTSYAQTIFAKPLDEITEADLINYFQHERDETLNLEFKSYTDKSSDAGGRTARENERIRGVLKAIDAFLNSSGGLLIWGAPTPEEVKRGEKKVKMCRGALAPIPEYYDRDAFINKIAGQISPVPVGVRMQPVPVAGGYVYLFDVPESQNKPHQNDGRYYVRMDTRTDAAPHYLVYALCHQIKTPTLSIDTILTGEVARYIHNNDPAIARLNVIISNKTPFVHDENVYILVKSNTLRFSLNPLIQGYYPQIHKRDIADILPLGLPQTISLYIELSQGFEEEEHRFDVWYGGARSTVTQAVFKLKCKMKRTSGQQISYDISIELVEEIGLDRLNELETDLGTD